MFLYELRCGALFTTLSNTRSISPGYDITEFTNATKLLGFKVFWRHSAFPRVFTQNNKYLLRFARFLTGRRGAVFFDLPDAGYWQ